MTSYDAPSHTTPAHAVTLFEDTDFSQWNAFVAATPEANFFHRAEWKRVLERAFGIRTHYLCAKKDKKICGLLPLAFVRRPNLKRALVSMPFCVYGGAIADHPQIARDLEDAAADLAAKTNCDYLEIRNPTPTRPDWPTSDLYFTFQRPLHADMEQNLLAIPRKERADIRKSIKAGLQSDLDGNAARFFPIYARSARDLGTPTLPQRYFDILLEEFGEHAEIRIVRKDTTPICGVLSFYFRDQVLPYYAGGLPAVRALKGYHFMYWDLMREAAERGLRHFDYGRSIQGSGAFAFKKNWGFEPKPLAYQYHLVRARTLPQMDPNSAQYRRLIGAWKKLPLCLANRLGPRLAPWIS